MSGITKEQELEIYTKWMSDMDAAQIAFDMPNLEFKLVHSIVERMKTEAEGYTNGRRARIKYSARQFKNSAVLKRLLNYPQGAADTEIIGDMPRRKFTGEVFGLEREELIYFDTVNKKYYPTEKAREL
jgi:hypothetical protein